MTWRDDLRPGSFRGIPFFCNSSDVPVGRRVQVNTYPLRDSASTTDLGRKALSFSLSAVVIGDDYMAQRDALIAALEQAGPGELIHPWRGRIWATLISDATVSESDQEGGMARFSMEFIEEGERPAPDASDDLSADVADKAEALSDTAQSSFADRFDVLAQPGFVLDRAADMVAKAQDRFDALAATVTGYGEPLNAFIAKGKALRSGILTLALSPLSLAAEISGIVQGFRTLAGTPADALSALKTLMRFGASFEAPATPTPARVAEARNQAAVIDLVQRAAAAEAVLAASEIVFASYQDADAVRSDLGDQLDDLAVAAGDAGDDEAWRAIEDARVAIIRDIRARGGELARLYSYTPAETEPALVIANRLYGSADLEAREAEIIARNRIVHPGFVTGPIEVLNV